MQIQWDLLIFADFMSLRTQVSSMIKFYQPPCCSVKLANFGGSIVLSVLCFYFRDEFPRRFYIYIKYYDIYVICHLFVFGFT